jgi:8-oxo-dGTP pyrophosphatase MutT (NUDIX family)
MTNKFNSNLHSHFTATGVIFNNSFDKTLLIFHRKLNIWLPPGGHIDEGEVPHEAVLREVLEETGIKASHVPFPHNLKLNWDSKEIQIPAPLYVLHEYIPEYKDKPAHLHYDFIYLLTSQDTLITPAQREVAQAQWFTHDELLTCQTTSGTRNICIYIFEQYKSL